MRHLPGSHRWLLGLACLAAGSVWLWHQSSIPNPRLVDVRQNDQRPKVQHTLIDPASAATEVPILMYHYIRVCTDPDDEQCPALSVSPTALTSQMQWLKDHGYVTVDLNYLQHPYAVSGQPIIITLDDGYEDTYTDGLPVFEQFGYTATWYIITNRVGTAGYLSWSDIRDLDRRGMTIGSHSVSHPDLTSKSVIDVQRELRDSKLLLEKRLHHAIDDFCYPYGRHNSTTVTAVQQAGYTTATTTVERVAARSGSMLTLPRVRMKERTHLDEALRSQPPTKTNVTT